MSSIRPLATIMLLAVAGFFLYAKITETEPVIPADIGDYEFNVGLDSGVGDPGGWSAGGSAPAASDAAGPPPTFSATTGGSAPPAWNSGDAASAAETASAAANTSAATDAPPAFEPLTGSVEESAAVAAATQTKPEMPALPEDNAAPSTPPAATDASAGADAGADVAAAVAGGAAVAAATSGGRYDAHPAVPEAWPAEPASSETMTTSAAATTEVPAAAPTTESSSTGGRYAAAAVAGAAGAALAQEILPTTGDNPAAAVPAAMPPAGSHFAQSKIEIQAALDRGELSQALQMLSDWQGDPSLTSAESQEVNDLLGQLAGTVIYSTEHRLEPPYIVQAGETLDQIATKCNVSAQLLGKINGVAPGQALTPGQTLKVVKGPFTAVIDLSDRKLVLSLDRRYAGAFPVEIDPALTVEDGQWEVVDKPLAPASGAAYNPSSDGVERSLMLQNPGALSGQVAVLRGPGASDPISPEPPGRVIRLGSPDIEDVYDILSVGSRVTIRR